jgi:serine/threonine protein phosphatase 1
MLSRLFGARRSESDVEEARYSVPQATRVYAIGDIHGRADLLRRLHAAISEDAKSAPTLRRVAVYLGDYVDRGQESRAVLDILCHEPLAGFESVHLLGNHEDAMLQFLIDPGIGPSWFSNGGDATLYSYGIGHPPASDREERMRLMSEALRSKLPPAHHAFLSRLPLSHAEGDYYFVHAGIRPGRPFEEQEKDDLLWIRDEFLRSTARHEKCVVHGHTITTEVDIRPNRVGIDTGAFYTGVLTALVLDGDTRRLIQTGP